MPKKTPTKSVSKPAKKRAGPKQKPTTPPNKPGQKATTEPLPAWRDPATRTSKDLPLNREPLPELNEKHLYFAKRLALNHNASKAARESGFNEWYGVNHLAKDPLVMAEVERIRATKRKNFDLSADRVLKELMKVAFGNISDLIEIQPNGDPLVKLGEAHRDEMAGISQIEQDIYFEKTGNYGEEGEAETTPVKKTKVKLYDKLKALEMLGRNLKLFEPADMEGKTPQEKAAMIRDALQAMIKADGA